MTLSFRQRSIAMMSVFFCQRAVCAVLLVLAFSVHAHHVVVSDAVLNQPLPGQNVASGYFMIQNNSDVSVSLVSVSHPELNIEIHESVRSGGRMRMQKVDTVEIPAGDSVEFYPSGYHLMVFGWGDRSDAPIPLTFVLSDGSKFTQQFTISRW